MEILIKKTICIFGYNFEEGCKVSVNGIYLIVKFENGYSNVSFPVICENYGKTCNDFINEINKNN